MKTARRRRLDYAGFWRNRPNADGVIDSRSIERACSETPDSAFFASRALDHAAFRRTRLNADNVIDSNGSERALREKPVPTFSQRALAIALSTMIALTPTAVAAFELPKLHVPGVFGGEQKEGEPPPPGATPDCPEVFVDSGAAMLRSPPDADSANVRYQLSLGESARQCIIDGDRLTIRVGIEGSAVLGAVGQPGVYGANLRVAIRRQKDDTLVASKIYRISASIPKGGTRAEFQVIADPLTVPVMSPRAQDDYEILVGFTPGGDKPAVEKRRRGG